MNSVGLTPARGAQVVAICDCYVPRMVNTLQPERPFAALLEHFRKHAAPRCATYQDYRQLLDKEQLDAVVIATPDHHHILPAMLACIRGRQAPQAPVEAGHRTVTICHLANIARELRRPLRWDPVQERFPDDEEANGLLDRPRATGFELPGVG